MPALLSTYGDVNVSPQQGVNVYITPSISPLTKYSIQSLGVGVGVGSGVGVGVTYVGVGVGTGISQGFIIVQALQPL